MPSVLDRSALEQSPLADLHLLANELGVDGFRRLRKPDLVDAILSRQSGDEAGEAALPRRSRGRGRRRAAASRRRSAQALAPRAARRARPAPRRGRGRRRARGSRRAARPPRPPEPRGGDDRSVEGAVELLANGSGFLRLSPPDPTDDDVYISAAQVKRCELVSGDRVAGPMRAARRSERFPSLIRVDTINGRPAEEVAEGTRFEELAVAWPAERIAARRRGPTVKAIAWLTPVRQGLARRDRRPVALGQVRGAAAARGGAGVGRRARGLRGPGRRAPGGDRRLPGRAGLRR